MAVEKLKQALGLIQECIDDYGKEEELEGEDTKADEVSDSDNSKELGFGKKPMKQKKVGMF